ERREHERRVAATPAAAKKLVAMGFDVTVESGAGDASGYLDQAYQDMGAAISRDLAATVKDADIVLGVQRPLEKGEGETPLGSMKKGAILIGLLAPLSNKDQAATYAGADVDAFAMEFVPRISRAQGMDVLSSQSSLAGYRAVLDGAAEFGRAFPMMMTAAGTIAPAKVFVLGAGVAGLQAIATARRLGASVFATDVRAAAAEQVESLGATFLTPEGAEDAEDAAGYAKETSADAQAKQTAMVTEALKTQDMAICTALIPGRAAPTLIDDAMVAGMKPGSVIVDLAAEAGGNCTATKPGEVVQVNGVTIVGHLNTPSRIATDASAMYARNLVNFLTPMITDGALAIDWDDEIIQATALTRDGAVIHPRLTEAADGS
ncbi:MAG: Re/Si-specific NAD(P)(+) transhydrogenase subunit alpha, partial [Alphaproteobacteria bacterium]|nr:Re/Si-specific NAD(P)(+) transhydrogenase subunit alpha [Alphaproteobacteria bacterium]